MKTLYLDRISFKTKLTISIVAGFTVTMLVASLYASYSFKKAALKSSEQTILLVSENYAEKIQAIIDKSHTQTSIVATGLSALIDPNTGFLGEGKATKFLQSENILDNVLLAEIFVPEQRLSLQNTSESEEERQDFNRFIYRIKGTIYSSATNFSVRENFLVPTDVKVKHKTIVQPPGFLKVYGQMYFAYSVIVPIVSNDDYLGYVRLFFSDKKIRNTINKPLYYKGDVKFILVAGEKMVTVSEQDFLKGKTINEGNRKEFLIYQSIAENRASQILDDLVTGRANIVLEDSENWKLAAYVSHSTIIDEYIKDIFSSVLLAVVIMIIGLIVSIFIISMFFNQLRNLIQSLEIINKGKIKRIDKNYSTPELKNLAHEFNQIIHRRIQVSDSLSAILHEDYETKIPLRTAEDEIAIVVNQLMDKLKNVEKERNEQKRRDEITDWQRTGLIKITDIQRTSADTTEELSRRIIRVLVNYVDGLFGAVYVRRGQQTDKEYVEMTGANAYEEKREIYRRFEMGQGIIGACALEGKKNYITNIPDNFFKIGSGLGTAKPGFIAVFPVFSREELIAVFELGFLSKPEDYKLELVELLGENAGAWISATENLKSFRELLHSSREKTKELSDIEAEFNSLQKAVDKAILSVQYTPTGEFISANSLYLNTMGFTSKELKGTNVFDLVKEKVDELKDTIKQVVAGKPVERKVVRHTKSGEEVIINASYSAKYNAKGEVTGIIFLGIMTEN